VTKRDQQLLSEQQEEHFRNLAEKRPGASRPRLRLALHCWRKGELAEALTWVDSGLRLDPQNINAYRIRANILVDLRQTVKAVETARQALDANPKSMLAHILTVRMLLADLQPGKAQEVLDSALDLEPGEQQLRHLKSLQLQILSVAKQADQNPLNWLTRKYNRRLANVAGEEEDET